MVLLRRYVSQARDILNDKSTAKILNDDETLNNMALLDDDTIFFLDNNSVDEYSSTYARQYNCPVDISYYTGTCLEQKRVQLTKSLQEYKKRFLQHEPIRSLNANTTDHMIECASLNMIKSMLTKYFDSLEVSIAPFTIDEMKHFELITECKKTPDLLKKNQNLPQVPSAQQGPSELQKKAEIKMATYSASTSRRQQHL